MYYLHATSYNGKSGWVIGKSQGNGDIEVDQSTYDSVEPADPSKNERAPRWDGNKVVTESTGNNISPNSQKAFNQINQYFINKEGSTDAGLNRVDSLMSNYPSADRAIANEAYDIAKNRISKAQKDGELTSTEASDLKDILDGKS